MRYGWLSDIRCTFLCISAPFLIFFILLYTYFFSLYICLFICTFVFFCICLLFSMAAIWRAAGCTTSEIKLGLAPDKSGNGASSAWSHFAHLLFLSHWEASALSFWSNPTSLPDAWSLTSWSYSLCDKTRILTNTDTFLLFPEQAPAGSRDIPGTRDFFKILIPGFSKI